MDTQTIAAAVGAGLLVFLMGFQILLALGLPLGRAAWGGAHRILPTKLRWSSLAAVPVLAAAAWAVLARANLVPPGSDPFVVKILTWVFAAYFALNTAMNAASKSRLERFAMTPVAAIVAASLVLVAMS